MIYQIVKKEINPVLIYLLLFTCLIIFYPLKGSLPSDMDCWYYIASFNYYYEYIIAHFRGIQIGQQLFTTPNPYLNGEPAFGIFLFWLPFKLIGLNDVWSYSLLIIGILTINAFSVYVLAGFYFKESSKKSRWLAGLFFTFNNFIIANIDNANTIFLGLGILAVFFFNKSLEGKGSKSIILFAFLALFQLLASAYNFMYTGIFISCIALFQLKHVKELFAERSKLVLMCIACSAIVIGCYLYLLLRVNDKSDLFRWSTNLTALKLYSFNWKDFVRILPGNIYPWHDRNVFWVIRYKSFFLGFLVSILGIWGLLKNLKNRPEFGLILLLASIIGLGSYITIGNQKILMPLGILFESFHLYSFYRYPFRIFMMIILVLSIATVYPIDYLLKKVKQKWILFGAFALLFLVENIPLKRENYNSNKYVEEGKFLQGRFETQPFSNFLFLPSGELINSATPNTNRTECIYMYWQTRIKKNIINGYSAFFPKSRMEMNSVVFNFKSDKQAFVNFLKKYHIGHIVYYNTKWGFEACNADLEGVKKVAQKENIDFLER